MRDRAYRRGVLRESTTVEHIETHVSHVFLTRDRAYKLMKDVVLPFADLSSPEKRRAMCHEEVRLNRRLAPDVYLGVRALVESDGSLKLSAEDDPSAVEYAVEMRRLDECRSLLSLLDRGEVDDLEIVEVAHVIAAFHARVPPIELAPALKALGDSAEETFRTLAGVAPTWMRAAARAGKHFSDGFRRRHAAELTHRASHGRFREGHGDLRLEHVFIEDGRVTIIDCAELDPAMRRIDVGADLSFLVMELEHRGEAGLAQVLVDGYREAAGDPGSDVLVAYHAAMRAWIRAKVALLRAGEFAEGSQQAAAHVGEAADLAALARRLAWRAREPVVLAVCGGAATGKSTLASGLSAASGLPVLSSDVVRKRLAGLEPTTRGPERLYSLEASAATYAELGRRAAGELEHGRGVIVDATFRRRADRKAFTAALGLDAAPVYLECRAPADVIAERARRREANPGRISDATAALAERQSREFEPMAEVPPVRHYILDATDPTAVLARKVEELLDRP